MPKTAPWRRRNVVVPLDGQNNHPTRPAPFIRTDEERNTDPPS